MLQRPPAWVRSTAVCQIDVIRALVAMPVAHIDVTSTQASTRCSLACGGRPQLGPFIAIKNFLGHIDPRPQAEVGVSE